MILQRLNMDSSWLVELSGARVLIDPWLEGTEVDYFGWFNTQWHRTPPVPPAEVPPFDAVLLTQKYADHCHTETLRHLNPPRVLAPASLQARLRRLLPEATLDVFDADCQQHRVGALTVTHLASRRRLDPIYDAYLLHDDQQSLMVANHGFTLDADHRDQLGETPPCTVLLSPFDRYVLPSLLGGVIAPGLEGLSALVEQVRPRRVAQTHDEPKQARGIVPALARIDAFDPETAGDYPWLRERFLHIADYQPVSV